MVAYRWMRLTLMLHDPRSIRMPRSNRLFVCGVGALRWTGLATLPDVKRLVAEGGRADPAKNREPLRVVEQLDVVDQVLLRDPVRVEPFAQIALDRRGGSR